MRLDDRTSEVLAAHKWSAAIVAVLPDYCAKIHGASVAALVRYGEPKIDEPLTYAARRMSDKLAARFRTEVYKDETIPWHLYPALEIACFLKDDYDSEDGWIDSLRRAPGWLLRFAGVERDAEIYGFELPDLSRAPALGRLARQDRDRWPSLPTGTIDAGGPCDEPDLPIPTEDLLRRNFWPDFIRSRLRMCGTDD